MKVILQKFKMLRILEHESPEHLHVADVEKTCAFVKWQFAQSVGYLCVNHTLYVAVNLVTVH
jgi:hypothetical protein